MYVTGLYNENSRIYCLTSNRLFFCFDLWFCYCSLDWPRTRYVTQAVIRFTVFLLQPHKCCDYMSALPYQIHKLFSRNYLYCYSTKFILAAVILGLLFCFLPLPSLIYSLPLLFACLLRNPGTQFFLLRDYLQYSRGGVGECLGIHGQPGLHSQTLSQKPKSINITK